MKTQSFQVSNDLFLVSQTLPVKSVAVPVVVPTHHVIWVDCSGSMYNELPKLRQQLKNKLSTLVNDGDLVTVGWFSSRNQFGILFEALPVKTVRDLTDMHRAIDRFLQPMGLTGFKQPIDETLAIIKRNPNTHAISFFFQTDGYDNQWSKGEILNAVKAIAPVVSSATFVEYGYYANRQLLTEMAENVGGSLIFCEDFRSYEPAFEAAMSKRLQGGKKISVSLEGTPVHGVAFALIGNDVVTFAPNEQNAVLVGEDVAEIHYLSRSKVGSGHVPQDTGAVYAALFLMSQRMKSDEVYALLKATGDVRLIKQSTNAYGKQALSTFQNDILATVSDSTLRLMEGYDPNLVPAEDAYTVLDLLNDLVVDDDAKFYPNHSAFVYKRTGRKAVAKTTLTEDEQKDIQFYEAKMLKAKTQKETDALQDLIDAIREGQADALKFTYADQDAGYSLNKLVFNEDRPNVSVQIRVEGTVDLTSLVKTNPTLGEKLGDNVTKFPSFIYRAYNMIKDGIVNVDILPVTISEALYKKLRGLDIDDLIDQASGKLAWLQWTPESVYLLNLRALPVVNRKMVKAVSAKRLFELDYARTKIGAAQKVFKHFNEKHFGKRVSEGYTALYGAELAAVLKEAGITDYSGFGPKRTLAEATDKYMAVELKVKLAGLSSLPKVEDVVTAMDSGKALTISQSIMAEAITEFRDFINSNSFKKFPIGKQNNLLRMWLETKANDAIAETRKLIRELAEIKFGVILGQVWFNEFASLEENTLTMKFDGREVKSVVEMKDIEVEI